MANTANVVYEVRTTGADTNGGGYDASISGAGTDYSIFNSAQANGTHGTAAGTTNFADATALAFTSAMVGNIIQISAGSGFTAGFYTIIGPGTTGYPTDVTLDRSPGTGTVGVWAVGGALATIAKAVSAMVSGNTIWVKATATYSIAATISLTPSGTATAPSGLFGYTTTRGDNGQPTVQASANNLSCLSMANAVTDWSIRNFILDSNSKTTSKGFSATNANNTGVTVSNVIAKNFTTVGFAISQMVSLYNCSATGGTAAATAAMTDTSSNSNVRIIDGFSAVGNACPGAALTGATGVWNFTNCIFANNSGASSDGAEIPGNANGITFRSCVFYNNGRDGLRITSTGALPGLTVRNCIFVDNGGYGIDSTTDNLTNYQAFTNSDYNAFYNNTSGALNQWPAGAHDVTLTGDPFNNGAGGDFSLNSTAGAGAACRAAGWPGTFNGIGTTGYLDIGAAQHQDSGGGGGGLLIGTGMTGGING